MPGATRLLRPEDSRVVPFEDASPLLRDAAGLRRRAEESGYLHLPSFLPTSLVAALRGFVRSWCREQGWALPEEGEPPFLRAAPGAGPTGRGWDDPRFADLQQRLGASPEFYSVGHYPPLLDLLATLLGEPAWAAAANFCWLKFPGTPEQTTRPHQDRYYLPDCPRLWTAWVPLVETPMDVGPLAVVPGSHRRGLWAHVDRLTGIAVPPDTLWATGPVSAGDVVLFGALAVHCAWSNVSATHARASLDIRYEPRPAAGGTILRPQG